MIDFNCLNLAEELPQKGDVILIRRKVDKPEDKILCKVHDVIDGPHSKEVILSSKNDYFIWDMYLSGESWVYRVWNLGQLKLTAITNTKAKFPRR